MFMLLLTTQSGSGCTDSLSALEVLLQACRSQPDPDSFGQTAFRSVKPQIVGESRRAGTGNLKTIPSPPAARRVPADSNRRPNAEANALPNAEL